MKICLLVFVAVFIVLCNSKQEQIIEIINEAYSYGDVTEQDNLLYLKSENVLFSGAMVEKDSLGRIVKELNYQNGLKHGSEIHFEYFESDLAVVVIEGNWTNGMKSGIWKSHDGEGQMTVIKEYN